MQTLKLSFANINCLNSHMAEVIVDQDVVISLEMSEEYDKALATQFKSDFVLLINKINHFVFIVNRN